MRSKLDQLLSPERLRDRWGEAPADAPAAAKRTAPSEQVARIRALVVERFPGASGQTRAVPLLRVVDDLDKGVARRFPSEGAPVADEKARADQEARIDQLLATLEDLLEVAAMGARR